MVFPDGTFRIRHSSGKGTQHFNPNTCLNVISLHGTYKLLAGTGKYSTLSGHGRYQLSIVFVAAQLRGQMLAAQSAGGLPRRSSVPAARRNYNNSMQACSAG